jgi:spore germination protein KC
MIILKRLLGSVISLALLSGCWDSKDIEKMSYVTALGVDYVDGKYITYAQVLNFANIAKTESMELGKVVPVWIGRGEGNTVAKSVSALYSSAQERIVLGHVRTIVVSENLLQVGSRIEEVYITANRFREVRYNILVYGTKEPIAKLFALKSILNFSPIESILSTPEDIYKQYSSIKPVYGFKFIADTTEGSGSCMLPSLSIDKESWSEDEKKTPLLKLSGAYILSHHTLRGWLSAEDLKGSLWLQRSTIRVPTNIPDTDNPVAGGIILKPRYAISPKIIGGEVQYNVKVTVDFLLSELIDPVPDSTIKKETANVIISQIRNTYKKGLEIESDVLNLENTLFRSNNKKWKEIHPNKETFELTEDSLHEIEVKVQVIHSGKYKSRK